MDNTRDELDRIQRELLAEETSLDDILNDQELNALLNTPAKPEPVRNFANGYGKPEVDSRRLAYQKSKKKHDDKVIVTLMATACGLSLGIIGLLAYWLTVLL